MLLPDAVQCVGDPDFFSRTRRAEKRELSTGGGKILEPDLHESDPHAAQAGFEKKGFQRFVKIPVP
jgi:hypothetical protein